MVPVDERPAASSPMLVTSPEVEEEPPLGSVDSRPTVPPTEVLGPLMARGVWCALLLMDLVVGGAVSPITVITIRQR